MIDYVALGAYIRHLRTHEPFIISQQELANRCELSSGYISRIESGAAQHVDVDIYRRIALALGIDLGDLFTGAGMTVHPERAYACTFHFRVICNKDMQTVEIVEGFPNGKKMA